MTANFGGARDNILLSIAQSDREPNAFLHKNFQTYSYPHVSTMAKRKSERDPEELPDASDKGKRRDDNESDSDEVCDNSSYTLWHRMLTKSCVGHGHGERRL